MQITLNEGVVAIAAVHAPVSSLRGRHVDVDPGSHGLTPPHPLSPLKLKSNLRDCLKAPRPFEPSTNLH